MLVVVFVFLAAQLIWIWFKRKYPEGNRTMKNVKSLVIVVALVAAVAVAVAVKQSKRAPKAEVATMPAAAAVQGLPRLVDLGADKCIPCKMMAPILEDLKKTYAGKLDVEFIDVWKNSGAGEQYGIRVIPTQIFFCRGRQGTVPARGLLLRRRTSSPSGRNSGSSCPRERPNDAGTFHESDTCRRGLAADRAQRGPGLGHSQHSAEPVPSRQHPADRRVH